MVTGDDRDEGAEVDSTVRTGGIASEPIFERSCWVDFQYWSSLESRQRFWVEWGEDDLASGCSQCA
jgi:hypothetical protein